VAQRPDGRPAGRPDRVAFTRPAAERIARVVRKVEAGNRSGAGLSFPRPLGESGKVFRVCTFTGTWAKDTAKTITFLNQTSTPNTVSASNLFASVGVTVTSTVSSCAIAKDGTAWYLIASECHE